MRSIFHNLAIKNDLTQVLPLACLPFRKKTRKFQLEVSWNSKGSLHYAKPTGQRAVGIPEENGTFSD